MMEEPEQRLEQVEPDPIWGYTDPRNAFWDWAAYLFLFPGMLIAGMMGRANGAALGVLLAFLLLPITGWVCLPLILVGLVIEAYRLMLGAFS